MFDIPRLKRKLRIHYLAYHKIADSVDCGLNLAETISSDMYKHKTEFNKTIEKLRKIDSTCPYAKL